MRIIVTALTVLAASTAIVVPAAAATQDAPPVAPYEGCSDWYLQSTRPMSAEDTQWVFRCSWEDNFSSEDWTGSFGHSDYYWNADRSTVIWFSGFVYDWGWIWSCNLYPSGVGMCNA